MNTVSVLIRSQTVSVLIRSQKLQLSVDSLKPSFTLQPTLQPEGTAPAT